MTRLSKLLLVSGVTVGAIAVGWLVLVPTTTPAKRQALNGTTIEPSHDLDGMTFIGTMSPIGDSGVVNDSFVFKNGMFFSTECDKRCGYPARPYSVRQLGDKVEFTSESQCLYKDAKIVWNGTVQNGTIKGVSHWTVKRWYWTIEKEYQFEGTLQQSALPIVSDQ